MDSGTGAAARSGVAASLGRWLDRLEKSVVVLFLAAITILIFSGVLSRFVFHYAIAFTEELARFLFVWGALLGASAALRSGEHGGIPLIANRLGPRGQRAVELLVFSGVTGLMAYLTFMTGVSTYKSFLSGQISTTTEIPVWTINFGMMLAFAIGVLRSVQGLLGGAFRPEGSFASGADASPADAPAHDADAGCAKADESQSELDEHRGPSA